MKKLLIFLLLIPLAFAAPWQQIAFISMMVSATLLGILFMVGFGFGVEELKIMAKEEFFQLLVVGILIVVLTGGDSILNSISSLDAVTPDSTSMQDASLTILDTNREKVEDLLGYIKGYDKDVSREASRSAQCSMSGMGYTVSGCGGYSVLAAPLSMAGGITGFALGELSAMERLVKLSDRYALSLLLPFGILLRTFKITRGGGGFLIALGISLHIMLPVGIIFNEMLVETFHSGGSPDSPSYDASLASLASEYSESTDAADVTECQPGDTGDDNEKSAVQAFKDMRGTIRDHLSAILFRATLGPVIALLLMVASIRTLTSLGGAEVDVSAISRFV